MGLFDHDDHPPARTEFLDLVLEGDALSTPAGPMPLGDITRAEFVRDVVSDGHGPDESSPTATLGGAVIGGALFGGAGAVVGGAYGSTVKEAGPEKFRTASVRLVFETDEIKYRVDIDREHEHDAYEFSKTVKRAMKHHAG
ncbi:MAG: hypothetical protein Q7W30_05095 [Coriobacteriia bacterium]|nr:hypothetical protein [Coriobacteriia bacterium]